MSIKCSVQQRPAQMPGKVLGTLGADDDYQLVYIELIDIDGNALSGSFVFPPGFKASQLSTELQDWDVVLQALTNFLGDVDTCVTMVKVNDAFYRLRAS